MSADPKSSKTSAPGRNSPHLPCAVPVKMTRELHLLLTELSRGNGSPVLEDVAGLALDQMKRVANPTFNSERPPRPASELEEAPKRISAVVCRETSRLLRTFAVESRLEVEEVAALLLLQANGADFSAPRLAAKALEEQRERDLEILPGPREAANDETVNEVPEPKVRFSDDRALW